MKPIQIFLGKSKAPYGWIHVKNFAVFLSLLDTLKIQEIKAVSFEQELEEEDDGLMTMNGFDCAARLIEVADGRPLPQCLVHDNSKDILQALNNYSKAHGHDTECIEHTVELVN